MSRTLNLVDHLLIRGRTQRQLGRVRDALTIFSRLAGFRELPAAVAEETQTQLAEMHLERRKYRRARRHLAAVLAAQPNNPRYHYLMAQAIQARDAGDLDRAVDSYRAALALDPQLTDCRADFGLLLVRLGHTEEGLKNLRQALQESQDSPIILRKLLKGLRLAGQAEQINDVLKVVLFRHPRDERYRRLWNEHQFQQLRRRQLASQSQKPTYDEPVLLPFVPSVGRMSGKRGKIIRHDGPSPIKPPHKPRVRLQQRHVP